MWLLKMRSCWNRVGPWSSRTGVLIKMGNVDTDTYRESATCRRQQRLGWCFYKPRKASDCQKATRNEERGRGHSLLHSLQKEHFGLPASSTETINVCWFSHSVCDTLWWKLFQTHTLRSSRPFSHSYNLGSISPHTTLLLMQQKPPCGTAARPLANTLILHCFVSSSKHIAHFFQLSAKCHPCSTYMSCHTLPPKPGPIPNTASAYFLALILLFVSLHWHLSFMKAKASFYLLLCPQHLEH